MSFRTAAVAALLVFACAQPAAAVMVSRTLTVSQNFSQSFTTTTQYNNSPTNRLGSVSPLSLNMARFNATGSQGQNLTLTGVRISVLRQIGGTITLNNGSGNARNGNLIFKIDTIFTVGPPGTPLATLTATPGDGTSAYIPFTLAGGSQGNIAYAGNNTSAVTSTFNAVNLAPYIGSGNITVTSSVANFFSDVILDKGGKGNLNGTSAATIEGNFKVEYFYNDPLPEPASWAMLIIGFGLTGAALRRQRTPSHA